MNSTDVRIVSTFKPSSRIDLSPRRTEGTPAISPCRVSTHSLYLVAIVLHCQLSGANNWIMLKYDKCLTFDQPFLPNSFGLDIRIRVKIISAAPGQSFYLPMKFATSPKKTPVCPPLSITTFCNPRVCPGAFASLTPWQTVASPFIRCNCPACSSGP